MAKPDKILAHELLDREVLDLRAGEVVGSVVDFGINREGKVQLIGILPTAWYGGGRGIAPGSITFLTDDRLCIANGDALEGFGPDGEVLISTNSGGQIYGKTVLLHDGEMLGELADFRFNLGDGKITDLLVLDQDERRTRIPIEKITTIGKDYIIIERGAAAAESDAAGEASPFSSAAAVEPEPTAAEPEPAYVPHTRGRRSKASTGALSTAAAPAPEPEAVPAPEDAPAFASEPEPEAPPQVIIRGFDIPAPVVEEPVTPALPEPAAAPAWSEPEAAPVTAEAEPEAAAAAWSEPEPEPEPATEAWEAPAAEGETAPVWTAPDPEPEPVAAATEEAPATVLEPAPDHGPIFESAGAESNGNGNGNGTNLDTVFSVPAAPPSPDEGLLAAGVVVNTEAEGFAPQSLQISKFDQKKLDFLRGKAAHRDIKDSAGIILVAKDELLDQPALERIVQGGVLGEVFIEMTLKK